MNTSGTLGPVADEQLVPELPRRVLPRSVQRHGHPGDDVLHVSDAHDPAGRGAAGFTPGRYRIPSNLRRAQITEFDTTKRSTFNADYNHVFNGAGLHTLKAGYGFQRTTNDIDTFYPGGYVFIFWDRSFTFGGQNLGRGTYGYYEVNDRRITNRAGSNIHSLYVQDQWSVGNRLTLNLGPPHGERGGADVPAGLPEERDSSSASRTSSRPGSARRTTCGVTAA